MFRTGVVRSVQLSSSLGRKQILRNVTSEVHRVPRDRIRGSPWIQRHAFSTSITGRSRAVGPCGYSRSVRFSAERPSHRIQPTTTTTTMMIRNRSDNVEKPTIPEKIEHGPFAKDKADRSLAQSEISVPKEGETPTMEDTEGSAGNRIAASAAAAGHQIEERLKHLVTDLNLGDQLSVLLIAVFTSLLLVGPYAVRHMKKATDRKDYDDRMETEDPVDEFAKLARKEWGINIDLAQEEEEEEEDNASTTPGNKNLVEFLLKDVFKSTALQTAAQDFVVQIISSEPFKAAIGRLVKELWNDLVTDPETVAQVIKLLEIAIQSPQVKRAAQELVLHVFVQEPEVQEALIRMIEKLGCDDAVQQAVVRLLTDSAHTTLNDPDLLDHSMEFATDVVGDDIVQQTAGEALRKSVGHAVRPATSVLLTSMGVGLLIFGIVAVGYSRSSEQEAVLFETAARSLQSNAAYGILRILSWPLRQIQSGICSASLALWNLIVESPVSFHQASVAVHTQFRSIASEILALPWAAVNLSYRWVSETISKVIHDTGKRYRGSSISASSVAIAATAAVSAALTSLWSITASIAVRFEQGIGFCITHVCTYTLETIPRLISAFREAWERYSQSLSGN
jgi:hypothetical protein